MKIGILTCIRSNAVCTRAGCFQAFYSRSAHFQGYGPDAQLSVLMTCNGCEKDNSLKPQVDPGMQEKVERLKTEEIEVMHVGDCRLQKGIECSRMNEICTMIQEQGIKIVKGTHREQR